MNSILRTRRLAAGLSVKDVFLSAGVWPSDVHAFEGRRRKAWPQARHDLANLLGASESDLFDDEGMARSEAAPAEVSR